MPYYTSRQERDELERAMGDLRIRLAEAPDDPELNRRAGYLLGNLGRFEEAVTCLQRATRDRPEDAEAWYWLGRAAAESTAPVEARFALQQLATFERQDAELLARQADLHQVLGNWAAAVETALRGLEERPGPHVAGWLHDILGRCQDRLGNTTASLHHFDEAVRLNPDTAYAHRMLGAAYWQQNRLAEALKHLEKTVRLAPGNGEAWQTLGRAAYRAGDFSRAREALEEAVRLGHEPARTRGFLAAALRKLGQPRAAVEQAERALRGSLPRRDRAWVDQIIRECRKRLR